MSESSFDFVADDEFRRVLESDKREMRRCAETEAWKAVHVLSGSIIEAVLLDYLVSERHLRKEDALKMDLGKAIELSAKKSIISEKVSELASAVKGYRNLVHAGRSIRTREIPDAHSAHIVINVLEMILAEIGGRKRPSYGYTAEQVVSKVERDPSARGILKYLVKDLNERETKRLLQEVIPDRYFRWNQELEDGEEVPSHLFSMLSTLFRTSYESADAIVQSEVTSRFVRVLKEESVDVVSTHCLQFFAMSDLRHLQADDAQLVKEHFFEQIRPGQGDVKWIRALSGIGQWLLPEEVPGFVDLLVKVLLQDNIQKRMIFSCMFVEYDSMKEALQKQVLSRLDVWIRTYEHRNQKRAMLITELKDYIDIPF